MEKESHPRFGFTMVEIISTLVIIGIMTAIAAPRFISLAETAKTKAAYAGIAEFNSQEKLIWHKMQMRGGFADDEAFDGAIYGEMQNGSFELNAGTEDDWEFVEGSGSAGQPRTGMLTFKGAELALTRTPATLETPARWRAGSDGWSAHSGGFALSDFDYIFDDSKTKIIDGDTLQMKNTSAVLLEDSTTENFEATMTAKITSDFNNGNGWGFYYRGTPDPSGGAHKVDGYCFQFDPPNTFVVKDANTDRAVVVDSGVAEVNMSDFFTIDDTFKTSEHTVTVSAVGNQHSVIVDGIEVLSFTDSSYGEGQAGFRTWDKSKTEFSDLELTQK